MNSDGLLREKDLSHGLECCDLKGIRRRQCRQFAKIESSEFFESHEPTVVSERLSTRHRVGYTVVPTQLAAGVDGSLSKGAGVGEYFAELTCQPDHSDSKVSILST